MIKVDR